MKNSEHEWCESQLPTIQKKYFQFDDSKLTLLEIVESQKEDFDINDADI